MPEIHLTPATVARLATPVTQIDYTDQRCPALYLRLYPSGRRTYFVRVQHQGLRQTINLGSELSVQAARRAAEKAVGEVRAIAPISYPSVSLSEFSVRFFEEYGRYWKSSTLTLNRRGFVRHVEPILGEMVVAKLDRNHIERWFAGMVKHKAFANNLLALLSGMMQYAEKVGVRHGNPCKGFRRYRLTNKERYLTHEELQRLWALSEGVALLYPVEVSVIQLLIATGCRVNEICSLQWQAYREGHCYLQDSKTGAKTVYLSSWGRGMLEALPSKGRYVFGGDHPIHVSQVGRVWTQLRDLADLSGVRLHDLRHTYASLAIQHQMDLVVIGQLLGHCDPTTTLKYAHLGKEDVQEAAEEVSGLIAKGMRS